MKEDFQLYMSGYAGSLGAARFASDNMPLLQTRFRPDYLEEQMKLLEEDLAAATAELPSVIDEIYRIAQETQQGFAVELRKIPVRQFTIELCELAGLDPYRIPTRAVIEADLENRFFSLPMSQSEAASAQRNATSNKSIDEAVCIGHTTQGKDVTLLRN